MKINDSNTLTQIFFYSNYSTVRPYHIQQPFRDIRITKLKILQKIILKYNST